MFTCFTQQTKEYQTKINKSSHVFVLNLNRCWMEIFCRESRTNLKAFIGNVLSYLLLVELENLDSSRWLWQRFWYFEAVFRNSVSGMRLWNTFLGPKICHFRTFRYSIINRLSCCFSFPDSKRLTRLTPSDG